MINMKNGMRAIVLGSLVVLWAGCQPESDSGGAEQAHAHGDGQPHVHGPDTHTHEEKTAGPNGGRLIASVTPNLEFLVLDDRRVQLTFVDENAKPIDVVDATVSLTGGDRQNPTELSFAAENNVLVSNGALPDGDLFDVILSIQITPETEPVLERIKADFSICSECQLVEYACICGH